MQDTIKWLFFGFFIGIIITLPIIVFVEYAYFGNLYSFTHYRFNGRKSIAYFYQSLDLMYMGTGQFIHTIDYINHRSKHLHIIVTPISINDYKVKIANVSQNACRLIVDMSYSSNIVKFIYINDTAVGLFHFQPISGHFLLVDGKAVSPGQDAYARRLCARTAGRVQIGMEISAHPSNT
ncbi:hypothetical protein [Acidiphilium sp. C61]|uniref:hypothetical protein n=1 Tax=Acidiphilium sp. C61 TaxID=1671485 RepID=UPI00157A339E|nr:hypothetical protein [Acidiphilium sp. C61]